jgi:hypothetical protein
MQALSAIRIIAVLIIEPSGFLNCLYIYNSADKNEEYVVTVPAAELFTT